MKSLSGKELADYKRVITVGRLLIHSGRGI